MDRAQSNVPHISGMGGEQKHAPTRTKTKTNMSKTIRKAEIKTTLERIRETSAKVLEINRNAQQLRNKWGTDKKYYDRNTT